MLGITEILCHLAFPNFVSVFVILNFDLGVIGFDDVRFKNLSLVEFVERFKSERGKYHPVALC